MNLVISRSQLKEHIYSFSWSTEDTNQEVQLLPATDLFETGALFLEIQPPPLLFWTGYSITAVFLLSTMTAIDLCPQEKKNYWKKTINRYNL